MKPLLRLAALLAIPSTTAFAADLTAPNAAFIWTAANAWDGGTATWNSTTPDSAVFGAITTGRTATLTTGITADDIDFSNAANTWTVSGSGGSITLNGTLSKSGAGTAIISQNTLVSGNGSVLVDGGELQLLNNGNTFSGGVTLDSGTLRLGVNSGSGAPQTSGSLGTGTFTINGGSFYHSQGSVRSQAVAAVIGGDFTAYFTGGGGGLLLGTTTAPGRTVSLGSAVRTITVGAASDGTGANAVLGFNNLMNSAGGGIIKEGAGVLRVGGSSSTAAITVNAGSLEVTDTMGAATFTMNSGTVWRRTVNALADGSAITLNNASLVNADTLNNNRLSAFGTLQVSGTSDVFLGSGLTVQSSGSGTGGFTVRDGGILGGNGTLRTAASQSYSAGVTTLSTFTDSTITLSAGGKIKPGTVDSLDSTIGTLAFGNLTWNGEGSTIAQIAMNLGPANTSDRINLSGTLTKGTGSNFVFDFLGFNATATSTYTLLNFGSQTGFAVGDFTASNISFGSGLSGQFLLNSDSLQLSVIPEPSTILAAAGLAGLLLWPARRRLPKDAKSILGLRAPTRDRMAKARGEHYL